MAVDSEAMTNAVAAARAPFDSPLSPDGVAVPGGGFAQGKAMSSPTPPVAPSGGPRGAYMVPSDDRANPYVVDDHSLELVTHVRNLFFRSRNYRRPLVARWIKNYEILRNKTWGTRAAWMPSPEVPEIYPIIASLVGWMTDTRPTFDVQPAAQPFSPVSGYFDTLATDLRTVLQSIWQNEEYDAEVEKVIWDAHVYAIGIFKVVWDGSLHNGLGNPKLLRVDPFNFYVDPDATSLDDAAYMHEVRTMSAQEVEKRWPGSLAKLGSSGWTDDHDKAPNTLDDYASGSVPKANPGAISGGAPPAYGLIGQTNRAHPTDDNGITIIETWLRTPVEYTRELADGTSTKAYYDAWRCIVIAGNCVLMDEPAEMLASHGQHPYERFVPHETGEFYGYSLVELLTPSQLSINRLLAAIEQNIWLHGNPPFLEDNRANIARTHITNKPGQRILKNAGGEAGWLQVPQLHPNLSQSFVQFYIGEMERISGLSAINRGVTPTGRNAEGVLGSVQEAAFVRTRMALRNLEWTLRRCGAKAAALVVEYYDTPRIIAIVGPQGERTSVALRSNHFYVPGPNGQTPMKFQLLVQAGSALPTSRAARAAEADALFAMQAIDEEAVLEAHDWPNRNTITARVREMKAAAGTLGLPPGSRAAGRR